MPLKSRVAIITGAARGIGRACAERFLRARAAGVTIADIDRKAGEAVARELDPEGRRVLFVPTDVSSRSEVEAMVERTVACFGRLDVLVNNAGIAGRQGPMDEQLEEDLDRIIAVNLKGPWFASVAAHRHFVKAGYGRVVNIASMAGKEGNPGLVAYSATKAALIGMTKAYAKEVATKGILVHSVAPAVIETDILNDVAPEVREYLIAKIPMARVGRPEEVAELVLFLSSDRCSFSTGFCHDLSGGRATY